MQIEIDTLAPAPVEGIRGDDAFEELMASVGFLLFHWSTLETALVDEIRRLRIALGDTGKNLIRVRGSLSERLAEWRALLGLRSRGRRDLAQTATELSSRIERLQRTRSLIAHSFSGATQGLEDGEPSLFCAEGDISSGAPARRFTLTEMRAIIADVELCRRLIGTADLSA